MEINKNIPVMFQNIKSFDTTDTRFTNVAIWIMHLNENLNGSYFSKESVVKALPSLSNTPILAYLEKNKIDELDASDHREVLVRDENGLEYKYLGQAYGVIPESCNPRFQTRVCDDGVEREFLVVDGLIWSSKFADIDKILNENNTKGQSMELHEDYTGHFDKKDNLYHFDEFKFYGACMLGDFVHPAMRSSTIEVTNFSFDSFNKTIQSKMEELKQFSLESTNKNNQINNSEVINLEESKIEELVVEEVKLDEFATIITTQNDESTIVTETIDGTDYKREEIKVEVTTVEIKESEETLIEQPLCENFEKEEDKKPSDEEVLKDETPVDEEKKKEEFTEIVEENVTISKAEFEELVTTKENFEVVNQEKSSLESEIATFSEKIITLEQELVELKTFKADKLKEELISNVNTTIAKFSTLSELEVADLKSNAIKGDITVENLEEKLFALVGKKNFTANVITETKAKANFSLKEPEASEYGELAHLFIKK